MCSTATRMNRNELPQMTEAAAKSSGLPGHSDCLPVLGNTAAIGYPACRPANWLGYSGQLG